jgi:methionyl-tRNA formyltransferase
LKKRLLFMGSADFSSIIMESLITDNRFDVIALFTQPDKPVGRKQIMTPPDTAICAKRFNIPTFQPNKLSECTGQIKALKPDFIIVAAYGQILKQEILDIAPCINLHTSFLPKNRGAAALQTHILENDDYAGVTAILMDRGLDTGDILGTLFFRPTGCAKFNCLLKHLGYQAANLTKSIIIGFDEIKPLKQIGADASYAKKLTKEDGEISFDSAKKAYKKFLAYYPWPGICTTSGLKIKEVDINEFLSQNIGGKILEILEDYIVLGFKHGSLKIFKVQAPSKNEVSATEYIRGKRLNIGDYLV